MSRVKKILISVVIAILSLLGFNTISNAYYVGQDGIWITYSKYVNSSNIYCTEHEQILRGARQEYKVISQVTIEGKTSTDHKGKSITSWHNAKLAYILNNGSKSKVKNAVWNYFREWLSKVGNRHAGLYTSFSNGVRGTSKTTSLEKAANTYADNFKDNTEVTDKTNKSKIKLVSYQKDGKNYIRIGPFNWEFSGTISSISVKDQNGKKVSGVLYSTFSGSKQKWHDVEDIKSGKNFYISVPSNTSVSKVQVSGTVKTEVKSVKITFLKAKISNRQNLIVTKPYTDTVSTDTPVVEIPLQGNLKVIKVNEDNQQVKLKGVGFYIQHKETGKYVHRDSKGKISYVDKSKATEFTTNSKGEISIKNLLVGTYVAYETKNPNYGYEISTDGTEKTIVADKTTELVIGNKQIYVKLSGYVWVDEAKDKTGDANKRNNLYDSEDTLLDGITVRLKDRTTGETIKEATTSNGGAYLFTDVLTEKLKDYYIEFEYDGLTYTNVVPYIDKDNGSKSAESETVRNQFNQNFSSVEGKTRDTGFTRDANGNEKHTLSYNVTDNVHEANFINNGQYTITANTDVASYIIKDHFTYGQEEIKYINLGLYKREEPDIALVKDLQNVRLAINGYEHTYNYARRFVNEGEYGDGFNVGVKFGEKYGNMSYSRAIYQSDYDYVNENDKSKELKVYVTYELKIRNQSSNLTAQINSIADYYDTNYQIVNVGTSLDEKGNVVGNISHTETSYNEDYTKTIISNNTRIEAQKEASIYVQFALEREAVLKILNDEENLENVAEINSYSIYDGDKIYAGIDVDSNPGNCVPGDKSTYEDDTDSSPALKLELIANREMSGKVFLDSTSGELMTGQVRQGSGAYEDGEKGIEGVDITLTENSGSGKVYTATTDANGDFSISDYIPGDYTLTYTWGDETYTVQNYKGTVYDSSRDQSNRNWYKEDVDTRKTDAIDNYETRQKIDEELKNITNTTQTTINKMDSTTPTMGIGVEEQTDGNTKYGVTSIETEMEGDKFVPKGFIIKNVDFGIVERARQDLALTKRVKTMKVTLANGQVIADLTIDENGNISGNRSNVTYMKPEGNSNGFVRLELDNELIQGAKLEVGYEIKATNQSELDYVSENFYKYGIIEGNVVTITPSAIVDYLDKNWAFDNEANTQWTVKTLDELKELVAETVYNNEESTIADKTILYTESLTKQPLEPTKSAEVMINISKVLTTTDEISLDNETEVLKLDKTGGSKPSSIPGNYVPGTGKTETDDSMAETTIVTPATGENQNYIMPIVIGATALIILAAGVIIIKKKAI